ncbi:MAG: HAMP domain-containing sensor histidine kinase [Minisyncoccia bacterium]
MDIFITMSFGIWGRIGTFGAFLVLSAYLIRGVLREAKQREQLDDLNRNLEQKVADQTVEIRKSYEAEKHARAELEKLNDAKNQFIMITQHHLRTPVTSLIWGLESVLKGVTGVIGSETRSAVEGMKSSADRLMHIVDDFLNITTLKIGTSILNISDRSLKPAIEGIIEELQPEIKRMNIAVSWPRNDRGWPELKIDYDKMREILFIVVENAVRYNREGGIVTISTKTGGGSFELSIENTGIGITQEEARKIGSSLFYRGECARKAHPIGMGIGLSVVKAIVKAHHGSFSIESKGKEEGAKVTVELPK